MPTKAELEAEVAELKKQLADIAGSETGPDTGDDAGPSLPKALAEQLCAQGIDLDGIEDIWPRLTHELTELQRDKPIVTLLAVFALGVLAGRVTKRGQ